MLAVADALQAGSAGSAGLSVGLALFGVLSIIRLRSTELDQHEVAYFFSALALGTVHSARLQRIDLINDSTVVDVRYGTAR
ncbi:DUF4956 domain-containing protein [Actinoplanes sp. NPDC026619]|uniref:DUF4956 domain-containing protein n=1 Tax=Actinoplanes sp. NPDC026619 TaxID=3155798 RepID=UPI0033C7515E